MNRLSEHWNSEAAEFWHRGLKSIYARWMKDSVAGGLIKLPAGVDVQGVLDSTTWTLDSPTWPRPAIVTPWEKLRAARGWTGINTYDGPRQEEQPTPKATRWPSPEADALVRQCAEVPYRSARLSIMEFYRSIRGLRGPQRPAPFPVSLQRRGDGFTYITIKGTR